MENTNPWLEITKQKEQLVFNETLIQNQIARLEFQKFLKTYEENTKEFQNPSAYDPADIDAAKDIIDWFNNEDQESFIDFMNRDYGVDWQSAFTVYDYCLHADEYGFLNATNIIKLMYEKGIWS